ncbi:hypothetical protein LQ564_25440 [Massilia sp. G4R7]|uniref:Uncharacterized protein n=1 Tax=Massilia phyllostachyos TaxID=2898585 RepID=A0ABS8QD16_9BURK|nr:hypothetical protein [Massilia phyllostachyos]MCD2519653.1 hypothetical protein [Massilia phyllostachyos]
MTRIQRQRDGGAGPRRGMGVRIMWVALAVFALLVAGEAGAQPVSPAEVLLFETDHLARTPAPAALLYDFRKVSNVEPGYSDTVALDLSRENGHMHARLRFLSGARKRELPDIDDAHGNPVLLGFLEHDIAEMKRLTGGSTTYFRKRIRMALANAAQLSRQPIAFQGKSHEAQVVRIQPYLDDPLHARFEAYIHKTYTFILSDAVPGGVYQISTTLGMGESGRTFKAAETRMGGHAGAASQGTASQGTASQGTASQGTAGPGKANPGNASPGAIAAGTTGSGAAGAGPQARGPVGAAPQIEETLTLSKVADPKR